MPTRLNPYISFKDTARQAITFYHGIFGGTLELDTFGENGMTDDPSEVDKIMHAMITTDAGLVIMAADTPNSMEYAAGSNISVSLSGDDEAELRGYFNRLSDGGLVTLPLEKAPWGDYFGMCVDVYGVSWMVNIAPK